MKKCKQPPHFNKGDILEMFQSFYKDVPYEKVISKTCVFVPNLEAHDSLYIKTKWEAEGSLTLTMEEWDNIWLVTNTLSWREFCRKHVICAIFVHQSKHVGLHSRTVVRAHVDKQWQIISTDFGVVLQ